MVLSNYEVGGEMKEFYIQARGRMRGNRNIIHK